jgi:predicted metal-dependent phosphotriesterase family hydrolase
MMNRRQFMHTSLSLCSAGSLTAWGSVPVEGSSRKEIHTVLGPIEAKKLGTTLIHEHILVDFIGADKINPERYDFNEAEKVVLPHLLQLYRAGCRTLVECTPAYLGRDPELLKRLSKASGLHLITNTGIYGAANDKFVPEFAARESAEELAQRWTQEFEKGIDQSGVRPGIIKIGIDPGPLSKMDSKLVQAAAWTHRNTGLSIATHCGNGTAALEAIEILKDAKVAPGAFVWVHAQAEDNRSLHLKAARDGAWLEFDGVAQDTMEQHRDLIGTMKSCQLLSQVLISQDAGWYHVGETGGGSFRSYEFLLDHFVPYLRRTGILPGEIQQLLIENPRRVLTPKVRKLIL